MSCRLPRNFRIAPFWLLAFILPFSLLAETKPERIYRKVLPSVMTLEVENFAGERFVGSAVLIADDVAATAWHVVGDARSVTATFADGTRVRLPGCLDADRGRDLALLKLEKKLPGRKAVLSRERPAVATRAFVIGAPKGYGFSISDGLVSQVRDIDGIPQYQISCPISPGNSGGPVLNERGQVIGIASWTKADAQNLSFAIPSLEVLRMNANRPMMSWDKFAPEIRLPGAPQATARQLEYLSDGAGHTPGFEDFTRRLEKSAGKKVTVTIEEDGKETTYKFTVPAKGSSQPVR